MKILPSTSNDSHTNPALDISDKPDRHDAMFNSRPIFENCAKLNLFNDKMEESREVANKAMHMLKRVSAGILDAVNGDCTNLNELFDNATPDEQVEIIPLYIIGCRVAEACTPRQLRILVMYFVEHIPVIRIAQKLHISQPGVIKTISLIRKKAKRILAESTK